MFNKKPETSAPHASDSAGTGAAAGDVKKPEISISMPSSEGDRAKASNSIIDEWLTMTGDLESEGDILVKGTIRGNIRCKLLIIDEKASVEGGMIAEEAVVRGMTKGTIRANRVSLEETARVDSEIYHRSFSVEEGARIVGALHYHENPLSEGQNETKKPAKDKAEKASVAAAASAGAAAASGANGTAAAN